jgi:hypothetical protein
MGVDAGNGDLYLACVSGTPAGGNGTSPGTSHVWRFSNGNACAAASLT